jgi:hypothetical protein
MEGNDKHKTEGNGYSVGEGKAERWDREETPRLMQQNW